MLWDSGTARQLPILLVSIGSFVGLKHMAHGTWHMVSLAVALTPKS